MTSTADDELVNAARAASERAYAPYSDFRVGAAVESSNGTVTTGCNVENASYGLTICAERAAVFAAIAAGDRVVSRIAIAVKSPGRKVGEVRPCGACLQVLSEFMPADGEILIDGYRKFTLRELLPYGFTLAVGKPGARPV
jgi:cytidine deaminase